MPRSVRAVGLLGLCLLAFGSARPAEARVFVVGVDGGSWNVIDPMIRAGELPQLAALIERGASAEFATVEPVTSPVVWTSIATGRSPESHGVTNFFSTRLSVRVPTSYERLAAMGHRVGLYDCLMTWPPVSLPGGFVIPGWLRRDAATAPADVWSRAGLTPYVNEYATARASEDYLHRARLDVERKDPRFLALGESFDTELTATVFYSVDMTSHRFWHGFAPDDFASGFEVGIEGEKTAVREAMRGVDRAIGRIAKSLAPEDSLILLSDHGFQTGDVNDGNVWLTRIEDVIAHAGLDPVRDGFSVMSAFGAVILRVHPGDVERGDAIGTRLQELLRSARGPQGEALYRVVEGVDLAPRPPHLRRPWTQRLRQWVVRLAVRYGMGVEIEDNAHSYVFALPSDDALLALWPDGPVRFGERELPLREVLSRELFTGTHHPTAFFVAAGGPIAALPERTQLSVLDVAPLLFYLMNEPIPDDLEGTLPRKILSAELLAARPPRQISADQLPSLPASATTGREIDDPNLVEKLRALGYID